MTAGDLRSHESALIGIRSPIAPTVARVSELSRHCLRSPANVDAQVRNVSGVSGGISRSAQPRFHPQPNACSKRGPQLELWDASGCLNQQQRRGIATNGRRDQRWLHRSGEGAARISPDGGCFERMGHPRVAPASSPRRETASADISVSRRIRQVRGC
jgi:hypothetical protein